MNGFSLSQMYGHHGVSVFPCAGAGPKIKQPMVPRGFHAASADKETVAEWDVFWRRGAVAGLPCQLNGLLVIDADRHGAADGVAAFHEISMEIVFNRFSVPIVATPNNGEHYYFRRPEGLGSVAATLAPGIDVRDNGYVIAAGSVLADKREYRLINGTLEQLAVAIQTNTLPELPVAIIERIVKRVSKPEPVCFAPPLPPDVNMHRLYGVGETVASASFGERNKKLHWGACRCGEMVRAGWLGEQHAFAFLMEIGRIVGLPEREASKTIWSGLRNG